MKKNILIIIAIVSTLVILNGCSSQMNKDGNNEINEVKVDTVVTEPTQNSYSKNGITLTESNNDPMFDDAMIEMNIPSVNEQLKIGKIDFAFNVKNYILGNQTSDAATKKCANSAKGQHIHLILNNQPYSAHYESEFSQDLGEGHYVALAFLSRSYHMSIKHPEAYVLRQFSVGNPTEETPLFDESAQHLFYSRPKGEYIGEETNKIMLDFYLVNTQISPEGNKVRATINGTEFIISKWAPYFVEGLPKGENTFKIELIDNEGNLVPGPFNTEERKITLSELN